MNSLNDIHSFNRPLKKDSVVFLVLERIKEALVSKELRPGQFLPSETELTKSLGVGKSSIREAIKMLQAMGIVEVRRGHGTMICEQPGRDFINTLLLQLAMGNTSAESIVDLRITIEAGYTVLAMKNAKPGDIRNIQHAITAFEQSITAGKPDVALDLAFHEAILHSTHNPLMIMIGETVMELFKQSIFKSMISSPVDALQDHKRILREFCARDEEKLRAAIVCSLERWKNLLATERG